MAALGQIMMRRCVNGARIHSNGTRLATVSINAVSQQRRWQSADADAAPSNPKIASIVDQVSQLTLLETADLVSSLKVNIVQ